MSPEGAYSAEPELTGKASFGFVSKYVKRSIIPVGNTEFKFQAAGLNFYSSSYDWLVIAGSKAKYKGVGSINGEGEYKFMLTATDGNPDLFRIRIWSEDLLGVETVVYDNRPDEGDDGYGGTLLGGGSIVLHKPKK